jgi:hypothetical protein
LTNCLALGLSILIGWKIERIEWKQRKRVLRQDEELQQ